MSGQNLKPAFEHVWQLAQALRLPEMIESTTYGTPSLKVRTSFIGRLKDETTFAIYCPLEEKPLLMESAPHIYFETDHYRGWPYILIHLEAISDEELSHRIKLAWHAKAPARIKREFYPAEIHRPEFSRWRNPSR